MVFIPYVDIKPENWDEVVNHSEDGWYFNLYDWLQMITNVWNQRFKMDNLSFSVCENNHIVAVMPLHFYASEKKLVSSGWGHGGPVVNSHVTQTDRQRLWKQILQHVDDIGHQVGAQEISISISPLNLSSLNNPWGVNPLVMQGYMDNSTHTWVTDLSNTEEELWHLLSENARREIRQAKTNGYYIRQCAWEEMV